jgi:arylsulfatase A-like enzyme
MELCDIPLEKKYDGKSLVNIIKNGSAEEEKPAYSFWHNSLSIRTNRYRLSKFYRNKKILFELYDHLVDPEENNNIAADRPDIVRKIQPLLESREPTFYSTQ